MPWKWKSNLTYVNLQKKRHKESNFSWDEFSICILYLPKTTVLKSVHIKINLCNIFQDDYVSVCNALRMKKMGMKNNTYQYFYLPIFLGLIFTVSLIPFSQRRFANMKSALYVWEVWQNIRTDFFFINGSLIFGR